MIQTPTQTASNFELRPIWNRLFRLDWKFGLVLILLICIPRFVMVMNASASGNYSTIGLIMLISAIVPFVFLSRYGRMTLIWVSCMFLLSLLFFWSKKRSGSILGSILCHAAFNLGMIYSIFYLL